MKTFKNLLPQDILTNIYLFDDTYKYKYNTIILQFAKYQCWNLDINLTPNIMNQSFQQFCYIEKLLLGY